MDSLLLQCTALILYIDTCYYMCSLCILLWFSRFSIYSNLHFHPSLCLYLPLCVLSCALISTSAFLNYFFMAFLLYQNMYCGKMSDLLMCFQRAVYSFVPIWLRIFVAVHIQCLEEAVNTFFVYCLFKQCTMEYV